MTATNCQLLMAPNLTARLQQGWDLLGNAGEDQFPKKKAKHASIKNLPTPSPEVQRFRILQP